MRKVKNAIAKQKCDHRGKREIATPHSGWGIPMGWWSIRRAKGWASWAAASGLSFAALPVAAQAPAPLGAEFQVNSYTTSFQLAPSVAVAGDGDFIVVWQSNGSAGTDTDGYSIQAQRYASSGSAQGAQFQVNTYTTNQQVLPSVAVAADGTFIVVWESNGSAGTDTDGYGIQGQRYASSGSPQGAQFQINTYTGSAQFEPSVAVDADGDFVVVWSSWGSSGTDVDGYSVQAQRYTSSGSTQGAQFQVNTYTTSNQVDPSVAAAANGDFVVAWMSIGSSGTDASDLQHPGPALRLGRIAPRARSSRSTPTRRAGRSFPPSRRAADGDFVVVWSSSGSSGTDTDGYSIQGQRYASNGSPRARSSRSTPTRRVPRGLFPWRWMPTGASSWRGRSYAARPPRMRTTTASRASATPRADPP